MRWNKAVTALGLAVGVTVALSGFAHEAAVDGGARMESKEGRVSGEAPAHRDLASRPGSWVVPAEVGRRGVARLLEVWPPYRQRGSMETQTVVQSPVGLQEAFSSALGGDQRRFAVSHDGTGRPVASGGGLSTVFGRSGPSVSVGDAVLSLHLSGIGAPNRLVRPRISGPTAVTNRVFYRSAGMSEWYRNGPLGLEQGFTVTHRPGRTGWLDIALRISGGLVARQHHDEALLALPGGAPLLRYSGLSAVDASNRPLRARLIIARGALRLRVHDSGARYPITIDPLIEQATLTPTDESGQAHFGNSVSLSANGDTALIGGPGDNSNVGASWVFTRSGSRWAQQGSKLTPTDASGAPAFGTTVALSADGTTALIGGPRDHPLSFIYATGAAWVFTHSGSAWTQQGPKLTAGDQVLPDNNGFGANVAVSGDGNSAVIGAEEAAWIFGRSGTTWTQTTTKLTPSDEAAPSRFGEAVALSTDGQIALIGGREDNNYTGAAWVFAQSGAGWAQQGPKLTASDETGANNSFGSSVALSRDGATALIGGNGAQDDNGIGAAWVFTRSSSTWFQQGPKLTGSDERTADWFGTSVALSADGNMALIGGPALPDPTGAVWVFRRGAGAWTQQGAKSTDAAIWGFGASVSSTADASMAVIGGLDAAAAFTYSAPPPPPPPTHKPFNTSPVTITGAGVPTPRVGTRLTCGRGSWGGDLPMTFTYTWLRPGTTSRTVLAGPSTAPTYVPQPADQGLGVYCEVTATNHAGASRAFSQAVYIPLPAHHYRVELKAWIPFEHVVDPEMSVEPTPYVEAGFIEPVCRVPSFLAQFTTNVISLYRGDAHTPYAGGFRALASVEFDWDGTAIRNFHEAPGPHFGTTHRDIAQNGPDGQFACTEEKTATQAVPVQETGSRSFAMSIDSKNPLINPLIDPAIDSTLTGQFDTDGGLTLSWQSDLFPSHGFRIQRDGRDALVATTNDPAVCMSEGDARGPLGAQRLAFGLLHPNSAGQTFLPVGATGRGLYRVGLLCSQNLFSTSLPPTAAPAASEARAASGSAALVTVSRIAHRKQSHAVGLTKAAAQGWVSLERSSDDRVLHVLSDTALPVALHIRKLPFMVRRLRPNSAGRPQAFITRKRVTVMLRRSVVVRGARGHRLSPQNGGLRPPLVRAHVARHRRRATITFKITSRIPVASVYVSFGRRFNRIRGRRLTISTRKLRNLAYYAVNVLGIRSGLRTTTRSS